MWEGEEGTSLPSPLPGPVEETDLTNRFFSDMLSLPARSHPETSLFILGFQAERFGCPF